MSWLNYVDDAGRQLPKSFMEALERLTSGRYNLGDIAKQETAATRTAENIGRSAYTQQRLNLYNELNDTFRGVEMERALREKALDDMIQQDLSPASTAALDELDDLDRLGYQTEIDELWTTLPLADRFNISDQVGRVGGWDRISTNDIRGVRDYIRKNGRYPRRPPITGEQ